MKSESENTLPRMMTAAYLALLFLLLPLALHRGYFDITETKHACFLVLSCAYLLCLAAVRVAERIKARRFPRPLAALRGLDAGDWLMLGFVMAFLLSSLLAPDWNTAFFGPTNRYQGLLTTLLYGAVWFCVSRNFAFPGVDEIALVIGFCAACLVTVLQGMGLDPFGLRSMLTEMDRLRYVSTLGNINFYSGYLAAMLAFVLARWCTVTGWRRGLYATALVFGAGGALFSGSESFAAAMIALCALLPLGLLDDPRAMRRYSSGLLLLLIVAETLFWLTKSARGLTVSFFLRQTLNPPVAAAIAAACVLLWYAARRMRPETLRRFRKPYLFALLTIVTATVILLILVNTVWETRSFGAADRFIKFNESWGTDRGRVWRFCIERYAAFDPLHKFFGGGPGCVYALAGKTVFPDAALDSAHNEYLHYLLTVGAFGLTCYLGMLGATCGKAVRRRAQEPLVIALLMGVVCYLAQATVNIAQPASTPYLFMLLGMLQGAMRKGGAACGECLWRRQPTEPTDAPRASCPIQPRPKK